MTTKKEIPVEAIKKLPNGYVILGWGGEFKTANEAECILLYPAAGCCWSSPNKEWNLGYASEIFAAKADSDIVKRNNPIHVAIDKAMEEFKNQSVLPTDDAERAECIVGTYNTKYFPNALVAKARHSYANNMKHNGEGGGSARWAKDKSIGSLDRIQRHHMDFQDALDRGDLEEARSHLTAAAWRGDELLERFITRIEPFNKL